MDKKKINDLAEELRLKQAEITKNLQEARKILKKIQEELMEDL